MNIEQALFWSKNLLKDNGVEGPEASAEFLLRQTLGQSKEFLYTHPEYDLTHLQLTKFQEWVSRRAKHEPVWYICGKIEFLGVDLVVNGNVLIPRPETELLIEKLAEYFRDGFAPKSILDIGTGSGAIIISIANMLSSHASRDCDAKYFASDISREALEVAKQNAKSLGFTKTIEFKVGSLFEPWKGLGFDLIVTNLPYIPHEDMATLALDLVHYEPRTALDGGHEGLELYEEFFDSLQAHLNDNGKVFCEIGYDQGDKIKQYLQKTMSGAKVTVIGDYADIDRIVIIES